MTDYTLNKNLLLKAIEEGAFPRFLYKYKDSSCYTEDIFHSSRIWFSKPKAFNDPFDCQLSEVENHDPITANRWLDSVLKNHPDEKLLKRAKPTMAQLEGIMENAKAEALSNIGVLCLSKTFESLLMWSHYTDSHKGIVIEFDLARDLEFFLAPVTVKYTEEYTPTDYFLDERKSVERIISTKSESWRYEAEVRIIKVAKSGLIDFNPEAIKSVTFGCRAQKVFVQRIRLLCKKTALQHIKFYSMRTARSSFSLEREELVT